MKIGKILTACMILILKVYKVVISPLFPPSCRYYPSCSKYAAEALKKHGLIKGSYLSVRRVLRCNPFFPGGYDPVPRLKG
jgi:uncharacterized protein